MQNTRDMERDQPIQYTVSVFSNGDKFWYHQDKLHREDGPAVKCSDGYKEWWINGKLHREDGPAIEYPDGSYCWYFDGVYHREDGPAIFQKCGGRKEYYHHGKIIRKSI